ncbi:ran GTPase-activating 1 [Brachionus plicatilis]|uniref:Ran GTPase-activating 1 n=1 Tax=Brachionus plicatilis TaxID=10195 RepID=A0A3M7SI00_BRAPC|nr:ran GTPase-activating 1 [Brachionus plicatilis]
MKSSITDIEHLSKSRQNYADELSFAGQGLKLNTRQDAHQIAAEIKKCKTIKVLRLEGNTISPEAADELSKSLEQHPELERLIVNDIFTGRLKDQIPPALKSLCGALNKSGAHLVEINMSDNAYGPIGLDALVDFLATDTCFSLREIRMHNNGLGPQGSQKFASALHKCLTNSQGRFKLKVFVCGRNRLELEGARSIGAVLKKIATLEEIQMPQNGIRPNGIEYLADACMHNPQLKTINFNDNTFLKSGAEWMSKALINLKNLEHLNLGDCLLKSKGALLITRAVAQLQSLKELNLSFNEVDLQTGLEICNILTKSSFKNLELIDLNGNRFGEDGKVEIQQILEGYKDSLASLSEDEGSEEEEEEKEEEEEEEEEETDEETSEVVVDEEYDDYDQVENEDYEEYEAEQLKEQVENINLAPQQSLFTQFKTPGPNLFSSLVKNNALVTNVKEFDNFVLNPSMANLEQINQSTVQSVIKNPKFNGMFFAKFAARCLATLYEPSSDSGKKVVDVANMFIKFYLASENGKHLVSEILTEFGVIKSEDKKFVPSEIGDKLSMLLRALMSQEYVKSAREQIMSYVNLRLGEQNGKFDKKNAELLAKCLRQN